MEEYLREIKKLNILTANEEKKLWWEYKEEGIIAARQQLITSYQPFVFKLVKQTGVSDMVMMDLIQEGNIGLINAVETYEPDRDVKFSTFATHHIRGRIKDALRQTVRPEIKPETAYTYLEKEVERKIILARVKKYIVNLPLKERKVVEGIYLADRKAEVLAREMGISLSYLYRLQKKAIRRLRGKLSSFLANW